MKLPALLPPGADECVEPDGRARDPYAAVLDAVVDDHAVGIGSRGVGRGQDEVRVEQAAFFDLAGDR